MKLKNLYIAIAILIAMVFTIAVYAQNNDGWNRVLSTMYDSIYTHQGGSRGSGWAIRIEANGDQLSDSVIYGRRVDLTPFNGFIHIDQRGYQSHPGVIYIFSFSLHHGDTTVYPLSADGIAGDTSWQTTDFLGPWNGTLAYFDSISLIICYVPWSVLGAVIGDFDHFTSGQGVSQILFYDGGEKGTISGVLFNDANQNSIIDSGENGMSNWKIYLDANGTHQDSTTTNALGNYALLAVPRGIYTVKPETKAGGWIATTPETTITIGDTLHWAGINFGEYSPNAEYYPVKKGWNMISIARQADNMSLNSLFPTAISSAYAYNGNYVDVDTLKCGIGYWLKFSEDQSVIINGEPVTNNTISVTEGWNMIGSLTEPIACADILVDPGMITSQFFGYNGSYLPEDTLRPGNGYWIKVNEAGTLYLNIPLLTKASYSRINIVDIDELPPPPPDGEQDPSTVLGIPIAFQLEQNYPNPFNPVTTIKYEIASAMPRNDNNVTASERSERGSLVTLKVYNLLGQEVATLVNETKEQGKHSVEWNAGNNPSGMYFYRLTAGSYCETKKMVLIK
ncbi:MAG: T9SS type A sorting domain-containing protein [Patescibacteria group bacterium]